MTTFKNFVQVFPGRCLDILDFYYNAAEKSDREVTLLLSIASSGFVVPYERLRLKKDDKGQEKEHPFRDRVIHANIAQEFDELLDEEFLGFWSGGQYGSGEQHTWHIGGPITVDVNRHPHSWPEWSQRRQITSAKKVTSVLNHLRNAIAHGNIVVLGDPSIEELVFLSETCMGSGKFKFITVSPKDFHEFLRRWLEFLKDPVVLPAKIQSETLEYATL